MLCWPVVLSINPRSAIRLWLLSLQFDRSKIVHFYLVSCSCSRSRWRNSEEGKGAIVKCFGALGKKETEEEFNFFRGGVSTFEIPIWTGDGIPPSPPSRSTSITKGDCNGSPEDKKNKSSKTFQVFQLKRDNYGESLHFLRSSYNES